MDIVQYLLILHGDGHYSLKEKVTPESVYFLYSPIKIPHWVELLTIVLASIVHPIPMKFLFKEAKILSSGTAILDSA